jgi:preprotein translocase subunit SecF
MRILTNVNVDWLRWRWQSLALSWIVILAGIGIMYTRGLPLGVDFSGGTIVVLKFEQPVSEEAVRKAVESIPGEEVVQRYGAAGDNQVLVRLPQLGSEKEIALEEGAKQIVGLVQKAKLGNFQVVSTELVGPVIGKDLQRKGIYATVLSLLGIMTYIALRFQFSFGAGALVASVHDVLITLSILTLVGYELSLNTVAALLTLTGYGVNDQIVIFDRVRENLRTLRREPLAKIINLSVNQTLPRTVITAGATAFSVLALYLFGGEVLEGFAFTMLVGIITSTYSTVFIASNIAVLLSKRPAQTAVKSSAAQAGGAAPPRAKKPVRKARAS